MEEPPDLGIRNGLRKHLRWVCCGLLSCGIGIYQLFVPHDLCGLLPLLLGVWTVRCWAGHLFDRSVKLSLTAEGLKSHDGMLFRWEDFRAVRLSTYKIRFQRFGVLDVTVAGDQGERELKLDVSFLERAPEDIAQLVQERGMAARAQRAAHEMRGGGEPSGGLSIPGADDARGRSARG
jgi:hypothetical protein